MERKLATIRQISSVEKHPGADALDIVKVDGWQCVSKIGAFKVGDRALYLEIDSFVPTTHPAFAFLQKNAIKWMDHVGARIKTIRLRGEISQGLLIPLSEVPEVTRVEEDWHDFAELLGILKWEKILPASLGGAARGNFPSFIPKTDQERIQNLWGGFGMSDQVDVVHYQDQETGEDKAYTRKPRYLRDVEYEVTVKLDGSSMTAYYRDGEFGVCSRKLDLVESDENAFWQMANTLKLRDILSRYGKNIALQGELVGPAIQGNPDKRSQLEFYVFDVFDIDTGKYLSSRNRINTLVLLNTFSDEDPRPIQSVPILEYRQFDFRTISEAMAYAEGPSAWVMGDTREGVVFKSTADPDFSFKIISNNYLLKNDG